MTLGVFVSWAVYLLATVGFAFFANRSLKRNHEARMAALDSAIEREKSRLRDEQLAWELEDARLQQQRAEPAEDRLLEAVA